MPADLRRREYPPVIAILLLLLSTFEGWAQFNSFRNFSVKDGLPSSEVYQMLQDSEGYLWFPTDMGVSRFNGYEFKNFSTENGLPDNTIYGVYEDAKHNIWFRSLSGKLSYYNKTGIHTLACNDEIAKIIGNKIITSIYVDSKDTIWLGVKSPHEPFLLKIAPAGAKKDIKKIMLPKDGLYIYEIEDSFVFGESRPNSHLLTIYRKGKIITHTIKTDHHFWALRSHVIRLSNKNYFASLDNVAFSFNADTVLYIHESSGLILSLTEDTNKRMLLSSINGVWTMDAKGLLADSSFIFLNRKITTSIYTDKEKGIWITTKGHGIFYIPYNNLGYYATENGLPESSISCLAVMDDKVVTGHLNGEISIFDKYHVRTHMLRGKDTEIEKPNEITSLLEVDANTHLISNSNNIYSLDIRNKRSKIIFPHGGKKMIRSKRNNSIWFLGFHQLVEFESLPKTPYEKKCGLLYYSDNIYEDKTGRILICSSNGLWAYTKSSGLSFEGEKDSAFLARIVDMAEDKKGWLWMVSRGEGIIINTGKSFIHIKQQDGLTGNMCRCLYIDSDSSVWVGTNNGLNKIVVESYQPFRYSVKSYTSKNGLLTNEVNYIVPYKNCLWLAHNNGISVLDPDRIRDNTTPPPVYITDVYVNEKIIYSTGEIELRHNENHLTIHYNGLSYKDPGHIEYKYRLVGLDTNWIFTNYTSINFQAISPGNYKFVVYAKNNDGYWSTVPAIFRFSIDPAWWQTWWFRVLMILLVLFVVGIAFIYRLRIIRQREIQKNIQQSRLSEAELKALRAQMNPHFVFNAINSVQYFITNNDPVSSQRYLSKFARLIRYVVDNSKPSSIPLSKELEALSLYLDLEGLRFGNQFEYTIDLNPDIDAGSIQIPSMLIQPFVENAIWHGLMHKETKGRLSIRIYIKEDALICMIEDNGIGRKRSAEIQKAKNTEFHKSIGISVSRERLDILNQQNKSRFTIIITDLENESGASTGTRVELNLPFY
ncbi:MAG: ypdA 5 [Bacteroidetes bacterium]|jgi:ligand-binding sensor domain-containing protein|nr:ypdA 5 [Bacteroidota bacterium]